MSMLGFLSRPRYSTSREGRSLTAVAAASAAAMLLSACGSDAPETAGDTVTEPRPLTEVDADATTEGDSQEFDFPSCEAIERQVAGGLETLEFAGEEVHDAEHARDSSSLNCVWLTEIYDDLEGADANTLMEAVHTGGLTLAINVPPQPLLEEDAAAAGHVFHDLRAERAGGYVFAPEDTDLTDPLGMMGVTVTVEGIEVTWGGGTYFDGQGDRIAELFDKDWGIEAAVTVHRLIWD